ncbi:hypothetical protein MPDQ_007776 [Monascus purpureus]|uniref:Alcohol dehydrogenase-like C-terminal domain-containing protein n=1 Tax=Monascus purpureus TaxID=5098 RepID=A0A507QVK2_MONPU|nr:hypothetical protein MPDQ_007776 [Monascus purpureus]
MSPSPGLGTEVMVVITPGDFLFAAAFRLRVFGFDISLAALEDAEKVGAEDTVDSSNADAMKQLADKVTNSEGLEGAIVASGAGAAYKAAIRLTGFQGTIVTVGVPYQPVGVEMASLVKRRFKLQGTQTGNPVDIRQMMRLVEKCHVMPEVELSWI